MAIKTYKPVTNGRRNMTSLTYEEITTNKPEKSLVAKPHSLVRAQPSQPNDSLAQSAEQLPFKQWVRGSNPRRVTRKTAHINVPFF